MLALWQAVPRCTALSLCRSPRVVHAAAPMSLLRPLRPPPPRSPLQRRAAQPHRRSVRATAAEVAEDTSEEAKIAKMLAKPYKYGFKTIIESDVFPKGLSEDVVRAISAKKEEPEWMLDFRWVRRRPASVVCPGALPA